ncbi:MAG: cupin domain-containing protein [Chloroflexota bacterium]|nr:MAG: cupin domain-containing protein [Chloroflexota bacterium]
MPVLKRSELPAEQVRPGVERRLGYTPGLMLVMVDFDDGPQDRPDPFHSHPHEQASYLAEGEVIFFMDGEETHLSPGDVFLVPSGVPHAIQLLTRHVRLIDCFTPIREDFLSEAASALQK